MWKMDSKKMARTSNEMSTGNIMGDDSRVPIDMCYWREWTDQYMGGSDALNIIWEGILR